MPAACNRRKHECVQWQDPHRWMSVVQLAEGHRMPRTGRPSCSWVPQADHTHIQAGEAGIVISSEVSHNILLFCRPRHVHQLWSACCFSARCVLPLQQQASQATTCSTSTRTVRSHRDRIGWLDSADQRRGYKLELVLLSSLPHIDTHFHSTRALLGHFDTAL
jgi:hypothetical protein